MTNGRLGFGSKPMTTFCSNSHNPIALSGNYQDFHVKCTSRLACADSDLVGKAYKASSPKFFSTSDMS